MEKYLVIIEKGEKNYSAFSPDVLGCTATGGTVEETAAQMKDALHLHLELIIADNEEVPKGRGISTHIADGVFNEGEIAGEYFITEIEIAVPQHA